MSDMGKALNKVDELVYVNEALKQDRAKLLAALEGMMDIKYSAVGSTYVVEDNASCIAAMKVASAAISETKGETK